MIEIPFYSILDKQRWARAEADVHGALRRQGTGRNSPCPCGSGKKLKNCCGLALSSPPQRWLDGRGELQAGIAQELSVEQRRDALHVARMVGALLLLQGGGTLPDTGRTATEWAALAGVLRLEPQDPGPHREALRRILALPHDLCLDYRRVVYDLVLLSRKLGDLEAAIEAQRWWVEFLEDFGKLFGPRLEAVEALHVLLVEASRAHATEESRRELIQSILGEPQPNRTALYEKLRPKDPGEAPHGHLA